MPRPACVNLPELSLQVLFRRRPEWRKHPAAVVASNRPLAQIEAVNRAAVGVGIRRGMRYATALSLASDLRAEVVSPADLSAARDEIQAVLSRFSPAVEPCSFDREIFWVDTRGLLPLFSSRQEWARGLTGDLSALGLRAYIAVGFSRFGTFARAKRRGELHVFETPQEERETALETPLSLLPLPPRILGLTESLGLRTVRDFTALPPEDIRTRLGAEALALYRFATDTEHLPLQGGAAEEEPVLSVAPLAPIRNSELLENAVLRLLDDLAEMLAHRGESARELLLTFEFEGGTAHTERITPARPSRDAATLARLMHLRLESLTTGGGIVRVTLEAQRVEVSYRQEELFAAEAGHDLSAADAAIASVRAELGNDAVGEARLSREYRPEERFRFEPPRDHRRQRQAPGADTGGGTARPAARLVRRIRREPLHVPAPARGPWDGPFMLSGHWWRREETRREYYYLHLPDGRTLWIYRDDTSGRWFEQGSVD